MTLSWVFEYFEKVLPLVVVVALGDSGSVEITIPTLRHLPRFVLLLVFIVNLPTIPPVTAPSRTNPIKSLARIALRATDFTQQQRLSRSAPNIKLTVLPIVTPVALYNILE